MIVRVLGNEIPYARWLLRILRDRGSGTAEFRWALRRAGELLAMEASEELGWRTRRIITPLNAEASELELESPPLVVGILGASIPMVEGVIDAYPSAPIAFVAAKRIEEGESIDVVFSYRRLPRRWEGAAFIVDPMLATGLTMSGVIDDVKEIGTTRIIVLTVIAAPEGLNRVAERHPDSIVYALAVDKRLNDKYFIVPGLGDAGDRGLGVIA